MAGNLFVGTSGFAYDEWRGPFYPDDIRPTDMLAFYAERFGSVEINYTFRKEPSERTIRTWARTAPEGFMFSVKAHQRITHWLRLSDAADAVDAFVERIRPLGEHLGPVLFQCPPTLERDDALLRRFMRTLPKGLRFAFEFRHPSWAASRTILERAGLAWCHTDVGETSAGGVGDLTTTPFAYLRLRREEYTQDELRLWAERVSSAVAAGSDVFCYFKHEEAGTGPALAARLRELVEGRPL